MMKNDHDRNNPEVKDFNYDNASNKDQYSPSRQPRFVNSNYALMNDLEDLEKNNSPGRRSNVGLNPVSIGDHDKLSPTRSGYHHPEM